jgi:diguanylate cyclase (GGDEF)-like protein
MCFIGFVWTDDPISHLILDATTVGYASGAVTRNTGRRGLALWPVALSLGPLTAGAALHGGFAYQLLAALTAFYWLAVHEIGVHGSERRLRFALMSRENERLAASLARAQPRQARQRSCSTRRSTEGRQRDAAARRRTRHLMVEGPDQRRGLGRHLRGRHRAREQAEARARYLSTHDSLTGLPNRPSFEQMLEAAVKLCRRYEKTFCLMFIDLDRFKLVNDTLGHSAGDVLLKETAARLKACVRDSDIVARLGGDEFVVILHDVGESIEVRTVAEKIGETLAAPVMIHGHECGVSASIGVAIYPQDATDEEALLTRADAAMYRVKQEAKNNVRFFSPELKTPSIERLDIESALRRALENNEFVLHYQPKRRIATGEIVGVEALLRWRHPQMVSSLPIAFLASPRRRGSSFRSASGRSTAHAERTRLGGGWVCPTCRWRSTCRRGSLPTPIS